MKLFSLQLFNHKLVVILSTLTLLGCSSPKQFEQFDSATWKKDKLACLGQREKLSGAFESIRMQLRGSSESEIIELLGKPDIQMLYTRNQRFFIYYIEKGIQCSNAQAKSNARTAAIRFNATGYVTEATYQQGKP